MTKHKGWLQHHIFNVPISEFGIVCQQAGAYVFRMSFAEIKATIEHGLSDAINGSAHPIDQVENPLKRQVSKP